MYGQFDCVKPVMSIYMWWRRINTLQVKHARLCKNSTFNIVEADILAYNLKSVKLGSRVTNMFKKATFCQLQSIFVNMLTNVQTLSGWPLMRSYGNKCTYVCTSYILQWASEVHYTCAVFIFVVVQMHFTCLNLFILQDIWWMNLFTSW